MVVEHIASFGDFSCRDELDGTLLVALEVPTQQQRLFPETRTQLLNIIPRPCSCRRYFLSVSNQKETCYLFCFLFYFGNVCLVVFCFPMSCQVSRLIVSPALKCCTCLSFLLLLDNCHLWVRVLAFPCVSLYHRLFLTIPFWKPLLLFACLRVCFVGPLSSSVHDGMSLSSIGRCVTENSSFTNLQQGLWIILRNLISGEKPS